MKKLIALLVVICLAFALVVSMPAIKDKGNKADVPNIDDASIEVADVEEAAEAEAATAVDYDALYALHDPEEVVANVSGRDVEWQEYFYWVYYNMVQVENYMDNMKAYYDTDVKWTDDVGNGTTYLDYVVELAEDNICQLRSLELLGENCGVDLSDSMEAYLKETYEADKTAYCGENASDEEFTAFLANQHTTPAVYERINTMGFYYNELRNVFYGENNELITDEQAAQYLKDSGFVYYASHILFMSEEEDEAILAKAQAVSDELHAIEDTDELVARFKELKTELDEDTGKEIYPEGYIFKAGQMVPEFESAVDAMADYQVSEPVRTDYGYHVIIRLPMRYDIPVSGDGSDARAMYAVGDYNRRISESYNGLEVKHTDNYGELDIASFIK